MRRGEAFERAALARAPPNPLCRQRLALVPEAVSLTRARRPADPSRHAWVGGVGCSGARLVRSPRAAGSALTGRAYPAGLPSVRAPGGGRRNLDPRRDRKSTRLNSSHVEISYAVFCLKQK